MKKRTRLQAAALIPLFVVTLFISCGPTKESANEKIDPELEAFIASLNFVFVTDLVEPTRRGLLTSNSAFMKMQGDSVQMNLPYAGTSHVAKMGGGRGGLRFTSKATKIRTNKNDKRNSFDLDFNIRNKGESFTCNLRVFSKGRAVLNINSSQRSNVQYEGLIRPIPPESEGSSAN